MIFLLVGKKSILLFAFNVVVLLIFQKYRPIKYEQIYFVVENPAPHLKLNFEEYYLPIQASSKISNDVWTKLATLLQIVLANATQASHTTIQILPKYDPKTYKSPLKVDWFSYENHVSDRQLENWERQLSNKDHEVVMELLRELLELLSEEEITYVLAYGTLLGSCRHYDIVPWDSDVDISIAHKYKERVKHIIDSRDVDIGWLALGDIIKIFRKSSPEVVNRQSKYPFIDLYFHNVTNTSVIYESWYKKYRALKSEYFPLKLRPFGKYWLPAPNRPFGVLANTDGFNSYNVCMSNSLDHRTEQKKKQYAIDCESLKKYHLFSERFCVTSEDQPLCYEEFRIKSNKVVYMMEYNQTQISVTIQEHL